MIIYYLYISLLFFTVLAGWESRIHIKEGSVTWPQVGAGCRLGASVPLYMSLHRTTLMSHDMVVAIPTVSDSREQGRN